ncbi:MFS transporter [Flavobacterium sp. A45]|uniref:MFS transporter n=1 Tax=Flavobacterium sp. A45 TaxID=1945862 RepID=UPI0009855643|nr:MFS transporter [Flavobacterium sp. A45]OOG63205.1 MFS transporter [Flavobacterium sp. A45]
MKDNKPWYWIPFLNFASGFPYAIILSVSGTMYKSLGVSNEDIGVYTSLMYLPWVIKPLWSPFIDLHGTKRNWFLSMQLFISIAFLIVGFIIPVSNFFILSLAIFWVAAFASASNDVASDGFYMLALEKEQQSFFLGIRSTFYKIAILTGNGLVVIFAGYLEIAYGDKHKAWSYTMIFVAIFMIVITIYNFFFTPKTETNGELETKTKPNFSKVFATFFQKKQIVLILAFILLFRLGESQLLKMLNPFLVEPIKYELDESATNIKQKAALQSYYSTIKNGGESSKTELELIYSELPILAVMQNEKTALDLKKIHKDDITTYNDVMSKRTKFIDELIKEKGNSDAIPKKGMGISNMDYGIIYGIFGVIALVVGGLIGGFVISRDGLGKWMLPMILAMHLPIIGFILISHFHPEIIFNMNLPYIEYSLDPFYLNLTSSVFHYNPYVVLSVVIEQFGYGFGFAAFMMYLIYVAEGESKTSHYSIATGFMALGMMLPGMASGFIQQYLGYGNFFIWVFLATIPGLILSQLLKYPADFGKKVEEKKV